MFKYKSAYTNKTNYCIYVNSKNVPVHKIMHLLLYEILKNEILSVP